MNLDALPLDVLLPVGLPLAGLLWLVLLVLVTMERPERIASRDADDAVEDGDADADADNPPSNREELTVAHAGSVSRGTPG